MDKKLGRSVSAEEEGLLAYLEKNKNRAVSLREIVSSLGLSAKSARALLDSLIKEGKVERYFHGGYTFYRLVNRRPSQDETISTSSEPP